MNTTLPMDAHIGELREALESSGTAVIVAPPGSGKTTRVPPGILRFSSPGSGLIVVLEPRRVAARAAARRMAAENGWDVGGVVGYQVKLDRVATPRTRILVVTEGILVRMLADDPFLEGVGTVIVDEFHERSVNADLALAMALCARRSVRPDLGIVVMSATMDPEPVSSFLGDAPVIRAGGLSHPVGVTHLPRPADGPLESSVADAVRTALDETPGDVLVFLPGVGEIRRASRTLSRTPLPPDLRIMQLYGDLPAADQDAVLSGGGGRKVVLATNVAETSVTIEGVTAVVDSGLARVMRHDPALGLDRLELGRISRSSASQRAGRAGRTAPGICVRLYTRAEHALMREAEDPEILRTDIAGAVLSLMAMGEDPLSFEWFSRPDAGSLSLAVTLLKRLGAVEDGALTILGRAMTALGVHPRLGRLIVEGHSLGHCDAAALVASLLSQPDPLRRAPGERGAGPVVESRSDVLDRLSWIRSGPKDAAPGYVRWTVEQANRLARTARARLGPVPPAIIDEEEALLRAIVTAFPDRVARRREARSARGLMVGGRGVRLTDTSAVRDDELFVCVDVHAGRRGPGSETQVNQASAAAREWLPLSNVSTDVHVRFDPGTQRVSARERVLYLDLVLQENPTTEADPDEVASVLAQAAATDPVRSLELDRQPVKGFVDRVRFLVSAMPELGLCVLDEDRITALLPVLCRGRWSLSELRGEPLLEVLRGTCTHDELSALARYAPERIRVPSGREVALDYSEPGPPVLAVRIQEMFGAADTPRVARGRVPVMLHLLAPSMRPQQITQDLRSFWKNTYPEVRRELRGRYPKHPWPVDPLEAVPVSGTGRRRRRGTGR